MHPRSRPAFSCCGHRHSSVLALLSALVLITGCEEERNVGDKPNGQAQAKSLTPPKPEFIVGKRTQEIKNATIELRKGDATVTTTKITAKDPITLPGNAYVTMIGQTSILNMQHAMDLYKAEKDRYPKDYDEFMNEIIKANNIALPLLPYYQKYGYDEKEHKLEILEYPDLKNQPLGR
jgi:hypothetical protein